MSATWPLVTLFSLVLTIAPARGGTGVWDESVDGDLSDNAAVPTPITLTVGTNVVVGSVDNPSDTRDFITFTIPVGQALIQLRQLSYVDIPGGGPANTGYHAIKTGSTGLVPSAGNSSSFLGGDHLTQIPPGDDMLANLATAPLAGTGFSVPLGPGTYTYVVQQTSSEQNGYEFDFMLTTSVPTLPVYGYVVLIIAALGLGVWLLRRQARAAT
jgi:hypothetical protein